MSVAPSPDLAFANVVPASKILSVTLYATVEDSFSVVPYIVIPLSPVAIVIAVEDEDARV